MAEKLTVKEQLLILAQAARAGFEGGVKSLAGVPEDVSFKEAAAKKARDGAGVFVLGFLRLVLGELVKSEVRSAVVEVVKDSVVQTGRYLKENMPSLLADGDVELHKMATEARASRLNVVVDKVPKDNRTLYEKTRGLMDIKDTDPFFTVVAKKVGAIAVAVIAPVVARGLAEVAAFISGPRADKIKEYNSRFKSMFNSVASWFSPEPVAPHAVA